MINLKEYYLCDLYEMSSGISTTPKQAGHGSPFVSFGCIYNNTILPEELQDMMDTSLEEQEKYSVKEGDIFVTRTSETLDELAMSSVAIKDYPGATFSGFAKRLRPLQNNITYAKFMAYFLRSDYFRKIVNCKAVMTLRASFNEEIFSYIKVKLPEYEHQVKCGDFFWTIEEKIRCNKKIISELELLAKTIYDYWFLQYDFPDENGKPYKSSGGEMIWNEELKREIPVGWEVSDLSYLCDITMGSSPQGESFNELGEGDIFYQGKTDFGQRFPNVRLYTTAPIRLAQEGDVLLSVRAPVGDINIASGRCCIGRGLAALHSEYKSFLYYTMLCNQYQFNKYNNSGTTFGAITKDALYTIKVVIPHSKLVSLFEKRVGKYDEKILKSFKENEEFISLRNFLLPLLMNGQVGFKVER